MTAIEKLLNIAENEVGYLEKKSSSNLYNKTGNAGSANYTKYGYEMHKIQSSNMDYPAAWCDAFVDWCFVKAFGIDKAKKLLHGFDDYTVNSAGYYKKNKEWYTAPKVGDQIFFTNSKGGICHTGLVYKVSGGKVYTIEGNTSSANGVIANGGCVAKKSYYITYNRIAGYGRPNYDLIESEDLTMSQYQELKDEIAKLKMSLSYADTTVYDYIDENMPEAFRPTIQKLVNNDTLKGESDGKLNLHYETCRILTILDRNGKLVD